MLMVYPVNGKNLIKKWGTHLKRAVDENMTGFEQDRQLEIVRECECSLAANECIV